MIPQFIDSLLDGIQSILMSFLVKLGPFFVAFMPAMFTAYAIYFTFSDEAGFELALLFAVIVGLAIETVGIVTVHTTIELYNAWQEGVTQQIKFWVMLSLIPIYVIGVFLVILFSGEAFTPLVKSLGMASSFLTVIVYVAVALTRDLIRISQKLDKVDEKKYLVEKEERDKKHEKDLLKIRLNHEAKIAQINVNKSVKETVKIKRQLTDRQIDKDSIKRQLYEAYVKGKVNITQFANELGLTRQTIYNYQNELVQEGLIVKNGRGYKIVNNEFEF